jgi:tol-pal system-associated acyl-CoA thioesterase
MKELAWPVRVYLEDTDAQGVVYNASYFRFMERARTEWLRQRGIDHNEAREQHGVLFVLTSIEARFHAPARLGDLLTVTAEAVETRGARVLFAQTIRRSDESAELVCAGQAEVACVDAMLGKPRRWPPTLLRELRAP